MCIVCMVDHFFLCFFFLMIRRPPRSTLDRSSAASDVYKRQEEDEGTGAVARPDPHLEGGRRRPEARDGRQGEVLSLIHISEPTRPY